MPGATIITERVYQSKDAEGYLYEEVKPAGLPEIRITISGIREYYIEGMGDQHPIDASITFKWNESKNAYVSNWTDNTVICYYEYTTIVEKEVQVQGSNETEIVVETEYHRDVYWSRQFEVNNTEKTISFDFIAPNTDPTVEQIEKITVEVIATHTNSSYWFKPSDTGAYIKTSIYNFSDALMNAEDGKITIRESSYRYTGYRQDGQDRNNFSVWFNVPYGEQITLPHYGRLYGITKEEIPPLLNIVKNIPTIHEYKFFNSQGNRYTVNYHISQGKPNQIYNSTVFVLTDAAGKELGMRLYLNNQEAATQFDLLQPDAETGICSYQLSTITENIGYTPKGNNKLFGWQVIVLSNKKEELGRYYYTINDVFQYPCSENDSFDVIFVPLEMSLSLSGVEDLAKLEEIDAVTGERRKMLTGTIYKNDIPTLLIHNSFNDFLELFDYVWEESSEGGIMEDGVIKASKNERYYTSRMRTITSPPALAIGQTARGTFDDAQLTRNFNLYRCAIYLKGEDWIFAYSDPIRLLVKNELRPVDKHFGVKTEIGWKPGRALYVKTETGWKIVKITKPDIKPSSQ